MKGATEYAALMTATATHVPACLGDARYTADTVTKAQEAEMRAICRACPVQELCGTYARKARPAAGLWAGNRYATKEKK